MATLKMRVTAAMLGALLASFPGRGSAQNLSDNGCVRCHQELETPRVAQPARDFVGSIHAQAGFGCEICHGGNASANTEQGAHWHFLGKPPRRRIPELCGRCHANTRLMQRYKPGLPTDQLKRYRMSVHGRRFFGRGDRKVAICIDCHSAHAILPPSNPESTVHPSRVPDTCGRCHGDKKLMSSRGVDPEVLDDYKTSVHWEGVSEKGDLSAPVCNDCHGDHGAAPPGVEWAGGVCANCHTQIGTYFAEGPHKTAFTYLGKPGCVACHGNHAIHRADEAKMGLEEPGVCGQPGGCHSAADSIGQVVLGMRRTMDGLRGAFESADSLLRDAERHGMPVDEALFELEQGRTFLVKARAVSHMANPDSLDVVVQEGMAAAGEARAQGEAAFEELQFRRKGLAISTGIAGLLVVLLLLKIRLLGSGGRRATRVPTSHVTGVNP